MARRLSHPYGDISGKWVRGSFHGHCSESSGCSSVPLAEGLRRYQEAGYDFVAVTDHDRVTDLAAARRRHPNLILLEGFEYSSQENVAFAGPAVPRLYELPLDQALSLTGDDIVTVVCHPLPHASGREYWTLAKLEKLPVWPQGIEIYNGHYGTDVALANGRQPLGTALWDEALTAGHRVWGFANDDFHDPDDFANAWTMVLVDEISPRAVVQSARQGRCYATTGPVLKDLTVEGDRLEVTLAERARGTFVGPGGEVLARREDTHFEYCWRDESYVRFEAEGPPGRLFLQPVFASA